ncbi:hypothetical protein DZA65_00974 [Dickeya dianthicola]|nr:hypothetical protein DZA65_00974 [Dickeya dianthicola]
MQMKSNGLVKILVPTVLLASAVIGVKSCSGGKSNDVGETTKKATLSELTPDDLRTLGIEGDTPQDTLRTLVGTLKNVSAKQTQLEEQNKQLLEENKKLKSANADVDGRINQAVSTSQQEAAKEQGALKGQIQQLTQQMNNALDQLKNGQSRTSSPSVNSRSDFPVGLGLGDTGGMPPASTTGVAGADGLMWVEPTDGIATDASGKPVAKGVAATSTTFPLSFLDDNAITRQKAELDRKSGSASLNDNGTQGPVDPVYTLPENSTLVGSQAMTALLGRIPIDGKVVDPYPFKAIIGKDNLTANGIELPDVEGAIVSGTATGDWTLSCVRGSVTSITFVFTDGTVRTLPRPSDKADSSGGQNNSGNGSAGGSIGWISDEHGIPCLAGERKSNASTYLPTIALLAGASAAGDALAQNQNTSQTNAYGGVTSTLTGDAGQVVLGKAFSGSTKEIVDWVKSRYGQTFDAIYVQPGARVAVHITRQLAIDYEEKGRKVKYDFSLNKTGMGMD